MDKRKRHKCTNCGRVVRPRYWPADGWGVERPYCCWRCVMERQFPHELRAKANKKIDNQ